MQFFSIVLLCSAWSSVFAALCTNDRFGENDPKSKDDDIESNTNFGYMMNEAQYIVDCCGIVDRWEAYFDNVVGSRTIYFQVWRPTTGNTYELVGQNSMTVTSNGEQATSIAQSNRITVLSNDRWGWWSSGTDIITYKRGGGEEDDNHMMTLGSLSVGATQDWSGATVQNDRSYAMRMDVQPNNDPHFDNLDATVTISSSVSIGTSLYTVAVDDIDTDDVSTLTISMTANSDYSFDTATYILTTAGSLQGGSSVDTLVFRVVDQCSNTATGTFTVTIVNEPPEIHNLPDSASISEDVTAETLLFTINATDPDGGSVTCSLATSVPSSYPFTVKTAGADYGIYSDPNPGFDYSIQNSFDLTIDCTDGELTDSGSFSVYLVKNSAPVIINLQNSTSVSTTTTIGTTAFTVLTTDAENDGLTYTMTCDPTPCPFEIFDSGDIQISEDLSDHTTVGYDIEIYVSDYRNTVGPKILTITLADINDPVTLTNLPASASVTENVATGTSVFTVSYNDLDTTQTHVFSMSSSPASGLTYFTIDSSTGEITTANTINYEALGTTTFTFSVTVSDPITFDTADLTVDVVNENESPYFSQTSYTLSTTEGTAGTVIGTPSFGISDQDASDTGTLNMDCGTETGYFFMDSSSGEVSYQSDYDLDAGSLPTSVTCTVTVTDSGSLTDTASLVIYIADANDNTPVFAPTAYSFYVSYYAKAGTSVGTVTATDGDTGSNGIITYTLDQTSLSVEHFSIDSNGLITVKITPTGSVMGYATSVTVVATATDTGGLLDSANVIIIVSDTTTTSTTTTTDRYRTFLEDTKNVVWVAVSAILAVVAVCVLIYIIYTCTGQQSCSHFTRNWCTKRKTRRWQSRKMSYRLDSPVTPVKRLHNRHHDIAIRHAPPPVAHQFWRAEAL